MMRPSAARTASARLGRSREPGIAKTKCIRTCGECGVFNPAGLLERNKLASGEVAHGQCRYYAPSSEHYPVFPQVESDDVACGMALPKR